jgi:hypothetical protein
VEQRNNTNISHINIQDMDHTRTKAKVLRPNGICECFRRTIQENFMLLHSTRKSTIAWMHCRRTLTSGYNVITSKEHSGRYCYGKTPLQTFVDSKSIAESKNINELFDKSDNFMLDCKAETSSAGEQLSGNSQADGNEKEAGNLPAP